MGKTKNAQAGNYVAPIDDEGLDPAMRETLGITAKGREQRPSVTRDEPKPEPPPKPKNVATDVGTPGNRPLTTAKNQPAIEKEIDRMKAVNAGHRYMTGLDMSRRRREGQLRRDR